MEKTLINMTQHCINVVDKDGNLIKKIEASSSTIRLSAKTEKSGEINGIPLTNKSDKRKPTV